jgi:hypothetical protein
VRRPAGVPVVAEVSRGAVQVRLDGHALGTITDNLRWESAPGASLRDHYALRISSGALRVTLEEDASLPATPPPPPAPAPAGPTAALDLVLDGIAAQPRP